MQQSDKQSHPERNENQSTERRTPNAERYFFSKVFIIAFGGNTTLNQLFTALRDNLAKFDEKINDIEPEFGPFRVGDIPHSQASILKAKTILFYEPKFNAVKGFELASEWYYQNFSEVKF